MIGPKGEGRDGRDRVQGIKGDADLHKDKGIQGLTGPKEEPAELVYIQ